MSPPVWVPPDGVGSLKAAVFDNGKPAREPCFMLTQEDDVDAHALRKRGWSISAIARHLGHDRKTIRAYLNDERVAGVRVPAGVSVFDAYATYCRERLLEDPHLWAMTLF